MTDTPSLTSRPYWSERQGRSPLDRLDLDQATRMFSAIVDHCEEETYLQEWFGYQCVDEGDVPGKAGRAVDAWFLLRIGRRQVWPVHECCSSWDEDTFFDMIELLYDHVSQSIDGRYHSWNGCGWHCGSVFGPEPARAAYRDEVNRMLARYTTGYRLSEDGFIEHLGPSGLGELHDAAPAIGLPEDRDRVRDAVSKFRRRSSTPSDRRDAVRDLADVLERLRPNIKTHMLSKDEAALFQISNQFWIRHNNEQQRRDYDTAIWWEWIFNVFLATYYTIASIIDREP